MFAKRYDTTENRAAIGSSTVDHYCDTKVHVDHVIVRNADGDAIEVYRTEPVPCDRKACGVVDIGHLQPRKARPIAA